MYITVCISQYAFHSINFTVCISQYAFHSMHNTVCISQFAFHSMHFTLYHGLAIYTEVTFVNVTLVEAVLSGSGPAVV